MTWIVETLNEAVDEELGALPADMRGRFVRVVSLVSIQKSGLLLGTALSRLCPTYGKVLFLW